MIKSSALSLDDHAQTDGRLYVTETHVFDDGSVQVFQYLADPKADWQATMTAHAAQLEASVALAAQRSSDVQAAKAKVDGVLAQAVAASTLMPADIKAAYG